jgi:hypothetical protein
MKLFTVIQAGNTFSLEADEMEYHSGGAFLIRDGRPVFAGPSGFTTLVEGEEVKEKPDA